MLESTKTRKIRPADFDEVYFSGSVLDIGCGNDLAAPHAQPFDLKHGDANNILNYLDPNSFNTVHSSHCLEHMFQPDKTIQDWWQLVKPGGHMITVVPHEDLYEQRQWPSRFNSDHKATFRLKTNETWSDCSYDLHELCQFLPQGKIISAEIQDQGYNYALQNFEPEDNNARAIRAKHIELIHQLTKKNLLSIPLLDELNIFFSGLGAVVDQTVGSALAQIQVIVQKVCN